MHIYASISGKTSSIIIAAIRHLASRKNKQHHDESTLYKYEERDLLFKGTKQHFKSQVAHIDISTGCHDLFDEVMKDIIEGNRGRCKIEEI